MMRTLLAAFVLLLAVMAETASAQTVYKSVDSQGRVTYTDKPPPNAAKVEEVSVQPSPSDEAQREARERVQRDQEKANQMRDARERRQQAAQPAAPVPPPEKREATSSEVQAYPDPNPLFPGQFPPPGRQPVRPPNRPVQLPVTN